MTPEQIEIIKRRACTDARALQCGYPARAIPYAGDERAVYDKAYAAAAVAYGVKHK